MPKLKIAAIAAVGARGLLGLDGRLPWHLPGDLERFRRLTDSHTVIMGRRTFESLPAPLIGRRVIVLSRDPTWFGEWAEKAADLESALRLACNPRQDASTVTRHPSASGSVFIAGGRSVYEGAIEAGFVDTIHLTRVDAPPELAAQARSTWCFAGDNLRWAYDPEFRESTHFWSPAKWRLADSGPGPEGERFPYRFETWKPA